MSSNDQRIDDQSRRSFIKKTAYVAPMILTLKAVPAFASQGSGQTDGGISDGVDSPLPDGPPGDGAAASGAATWQFAPAPRRRRRWWWFFVPFDF